MLNNPSYRAGYVDGALESPPTPEHYEAFADAYDYLLGHKDASDALHEGPQDPAKIAARYDWMEADEAERLVLARERVKELAPPHDEQYDEDLFPLLP